MHSEKDIFFKTTSVIDQYDCMIFPYGILWFSIKKKKHHLYGIH